MKLMSLSSTRSADAAMAAGAKRAGSATPLDVALGFWAALEDHDVDAGMALVSDQVEVFIPSVGVSGGRREFAEFVRATVTAFPDLKVFIDSSFNGTGGDAVLALHIEGTQAADWLGIVNQERFLDLRQAWRFGVAGGKIIRVRGYWDQNQVYRRLAVKRLDKVAII